jgi:two-component system sensor histidine kinase TctE
MTRDVNVSGSLRNRLALILTGGAAVLAVILFIVVRALATQVAQQGQDNILNASLTSILETAVVRNGAVILDFPYSSLSMLGTVADDRVYYTIYEGSTHLSGYENLSVADVKPSESRQFSTEDFNGETVRIAAGTRILIASDGPRTVSVAIAQTRDALSETLRTISRNVALLGIGFFVLSSGLALWAASTTSAQLHRLTRSVTRRGPQDLRPVASPVPSEMGPLVGSLNTLMLRLENTLTQSEDFIAEAAHRIRTPLATVRSHAEATLQRVEHVQNRAALQSMVRAIDESSRAAGQLLDHAMVTFRAESLNIEEVDLVEISQELVQRMTPVADMKDIALSLQATGPAVLTGDAILLQNAMRNLIDNALKYAPSETTVVIKITNENAITVSVLDEGAGFALDEMPNLTERFVRGKDIGNKVGSGLGLTIAKEVTSAHDGTMTLHNRPEGGACVTLSF